MGWNFNGMKPIYLQIVEYLINDILNGKYLPGERIPSVRELALKAAVNPNTVQRALTELETQGLVVTHRSNGRTVTEEKEIIAATRKQAAQKIGRTFLEKMEHLGYTREETDELLKEMRGNLNE